MSEEQKYNELREQKDKEIQELKQQLAENQKKKEDFKTMYFNKCLDYEHLHEKFDDKCAEFELKEYDYKQTIFEKDQDKISFAIEQLEKVKEEFKKVPITDYDLSGNFEKMYKLDAIRQIDNQIKQLKEGK